MGYRQVVIKRSEKLQFKDNQLLVTKDEEITRLPLEDINFIILEDNKTIITAKLLAELGKNAISLIVCDDKHEPTSIMYPYNYHFKQLEVLDKQLSTSDEMKMELWKLIVKRKIENQLSVLEMRTDDDKTIEKLKEYIDSVEVGDIANREGLAAKIYFRSLFGSKFIRFYDNGINAALNYGYTILKSCIVRNLAVFGLNTYLGINHKSKTNNFNLAYDLVEPYRAVVDKYVFDNIDNITETLSFDIRKEIVNLLNSEVIVNGKRCTVEYSIELLVISYIKALDTGEIKLEMPTIIYE